MNRSILRKIAKENGVSVEDVKRDMKFAIEAAYVKPNATALSIPRKDNVPTLEEFISYCIETIKSLNHSF